MRSALLEAWQHGGDGLPLVTRLVLTGETDSAGALIDSAADLRDVARAVAASISPNLFIEKVKLLVTKPAAAGEVIVGDDLAALIDRRSEEHTSELQSLMRISYAVFCLKKNIHTLYNTQKS